MEVQVGHVRVRQHRRVPIQVQAGRICAWPSRLPEAEVRQPRRRVPMPAKGPGRSLPPLAQHGQWSRGVRHPRQRLRPVCHRQHGRLSRQRRRVGRGRCPPGLRPWLRLWRLARRRRPGRCRWRRRWPRPGNIGEAPALEVTLHRLKRVEGYPRGSAVLGALSAGEPLTQQAESVHALDADVAHATAQVGVLAEGVVHRTQAGALDQVHGSPPDAFATAYVLEVEHHRLAGEHLDGPVHRGLGVAAVVQ
mmetsp:Transcript_55275/g.177167  ORF Transcript_55275/g.177167 Transcript_55275/m.177167 type:complete len:249 (+) Transcript_55275:149-895(+)